MPRSSSSRSARVVVKTDPDDEQVLMHDDSDDEIVREIDVYLSPTMASQLYMMQFPLQHREVGLPDAARIKPAHGMLELDQVIPHNTGRDGAFALEHLTHTSHTIPVSTHMALGKMTQDGSLHLVPLSHIVQMRPSFAHFDELHDPEEPEQEEDKMEKKPVLFQKKETERAALARKSSFAYKKASEESESWRMLNVCGPQTVQYQQANASLVCQSPNTPLVSPIILSNDSQQDTSSAFVHSLNYLPATVEDVDQIPESSTELTHVCAQLTTLLQRGWPAPYSVLRDQFPVDDQDLLVALSSCAVLVRGNFVLQSRLLPLAPALQQARTFILLLLQTLGYVQRVRLEHVYRDDETVTPAVIQMLLEQVARKGLNGWLPKLDDNPEFCAMFPEQTQLHLQYWERQALRFSDQIKLYNEAA